MQGGEDWKCDDANWEPLMLVGPSSSEAEPKAGVFGTVEGSEAKERLAACVLGKWPC